MPLGRIIKLAMQKIKIPGRTPRSGPENILGELFERVQKERLYADGKTFVDMIPVRRVRRIKQEYELQRDDPTFDLREFINRHFYEFANEKSDYVTDKSLTPQQHIDELWSILARSAPKSQGSLIALPHNYVVPGGRFNEQFYWDSYFIMLGLAEAGEWAKIENMIKNFAYMLRRFGFIPTGNRTYFMSRSQPPFFCRMVELLASHAGDAAYLRYLPAMLTEYRFWMKGLGRLNRAAADHRVVKLPGDEILNRYYDNLATPRPESHLEDVETAKDRSAKTFLDLRAAAESGWDFSSRWLDNPDDLATIRTTDIVPIDLNCLLHDLELTITRAYRVAKQNMLAERFQRAADRRAAAVQRYCYHWDDGFYYDYDFEKGCQTLRKTLASAFPLWSNIAEPEQAVKVASMLEAQFLAAGGLLTTVVETGQQWDAPNGWAPLQYVAIVGLRNYGFDDLANEIKDRWIKTNVAVYARTGKMVEKYNVSGDDQLGGGGEYPLQDGFGWTNGVLRALMAE